MLKRDKKAEFLEIGIVSMKYKSRPRPRPNEFIRMSALSFG